MKFATVMQLDRTTLV